MSLRIRRDALDILFARYIKLRDKFCQRCGGTGGLQAAHFNSRRKQSVRYDPDNCILLCFGCHQYFHENPNEFKSFMITKLGEVGFDLLQARMRQTGKIDREGLRLYYKEKINSFPEFYDYLASA